MPLNILEMNYKEAKSMFKESIRPLVVAVIKKEDKILVMPGYDKVKNEHFYRLPGGGIEFGETSEDALKREFREEIGAEIKIIKQIGISENIFTYEGKKGHEIVMSLYLDDYNGNQLYIEGKEKYIDSKGKEKNACRKTASFGHCCSLFLCSHDV